jgi:hypothetical protein
VTADERLSAIEARANAATERPWEAVCIEPPDSDYPPVEWHVVTGPFGDTVAVLCANRRAEGQEGPLLALGADAEFIARARADVPDLVAALRAVLALHEPHDDDGVMYCGWDGHGGCGETYPCSTVCAITAAMDGGEGALP